MNETLKAAVELSRAADAQYLARLDRLMRTATRVRGLAESMESRVVACIPGAQSDSGQAEFAALQADAGELQALADDLVLLGHVFRETPVAPVFDALREWLRGVGGGDSLRIEASGGLRMDQRQCLVLRERLQEFIALLLTATAAQAGKDSPGGTGCVHLEARVRGRSLALTLRCDGLELGAADLVRAARSGGYTPESSETLLRFPGRIAFTPAFAAGWGLSPEWHERLLLLRDQLRTARGDLQLREGSGGQWAFCLQLPMSADLAAVLMVRSGTDLYALPIEAVFSTRRIAPSEWQQRSGRLWMDQAAPDPVEGSEFSDWTAAGPVMAAALPGLLEDGCLPPTPVPETPVPCVILEDGDGMAAVIVDEILGERQILLRHPHRLLRRVRFLLGSFLLPNEEICVVLHPWDLLQRLREQGGLVR